MIKRELYLKQIRPFIGQNIVKVLTGIRRCGKSVMLTLIQDELKESGIPSEQFVSINFETKTVDFVKSVDETYAYIKSVCEKNNSKTFLFLDEVQELDGWEKLVNSCMIDFDCDIYVTGSNAKLLSGELATYLAGRYVKFNIHPFSFKEVMQMLPDKSEKEAFQTYIQWGGMPFLYQFPMGDNEKKQYLSDIYDSIMIKDIVARNKIRDVEQFKRLLMYLVGTMGNTFSVNSIIKYLKSESKTISNETLYNYLEYCRSACLIHLVPRQDLIGKNMLRFQEKIYLTDHGIREAIYGNNFRDIGTVLDNIVYMELLRRGYSVTVGKNKQLEVDFVAEKSGQKAYFQVAYLLADEKTAEREFGAFRDIPDNYPKYVLTLDEFDFSRDGYRHMNIRDFLLSELN